MGKRDRPGARAGLRAVTSPKRRLHAREQHHRTEWKSPWTSRGRFLQMGQMGIGSALPAIPVTRACRSCGTLGVVFDLSRIRRGGIILSDHHKLALTNSSQRRFHEAPIRRRIISQMLFCLFY